MLPVWRSVFTGSASAINCSMFLMAAPAAGGPMTTRAGGRKTTPCVTGMVRVLRSEVGAGAIGAGPCADGASVAGLVSGGLGSVLKVFAASRTDFKGGVPADSGRGFLALKKMSGHGMVGKTWAQFQANG